VTAPGCGDPEACPVPTPPGLVDARRLRLATWPAERPFYRVYDVMRGYDEFNPGAGDTRFAPCVDGAAVPSLYGGESETVALLESVFHDVAEGVRDRVIYEASLRQRGLVHMRPPRLLRLLDLRDAALARIGLARHQLVTTTAAHYPCTRAWSVWLHRRRPGGIEPDGLAWHSRQAELAGRDAREAFLLFGDRAPAAPGAYQLVGPGVRNLVEGPGRVLVEEIAEQLDAVVVSG